MTDTVAQKWAVYESNVQQYRILSATVQSFLLMIGSFWFSNQNAQPLWPLVVIFVISLAHIFVVWMPVVHARIKIVDYYKGQLDMPVDRRAELAEFCTEDAYIESEEMRRKVVEDFFQDKKLNQPVRSTRKKLDVWIPYGYAAIWIVMLLPKLLQLLA